VPRAADLCRGRARPGWHRLRRPVARRFQFLALRHHRFWRRQMMDDQTTVFDWQVLLWHLIQLFIYVPLGLGFFALAWLLIGKLSPFSLRKEIEEDQNIALAVLLGSVILGIAIIVSAAMRG